MKSHPQNKHPFISSDREKYQLACSDFRPLSIDLRYHEVYYVELELRKIQILKLVNKPIKDHEFPISIYEERELNPIEKKSPFEKELELNLIQAKWDLKSP